MRLFLLALSALFLLACQGPIYTGGTAAQVNKGKALSLELDRQDFENTAKKMIESMLNDPAFSISNLKSRKVLALGRIVNDTALRLDTDKLTAKITIALRKSGKFILSSAVAAGGPLDSMSEDVRKLRKNEEFDANTINKKGSLISPDFSLSGKIRQDNVRLKNGKTQVEYFFLLRMSDLKNGLVYWEDEKTIDKTGSSKSVPW